MTKTQLMQKLEDTRRNKEMSRGEFARIELNISKAKYVSWLNGRNLGEDDKVMILKYLEE